MLKSRCPNLLAEAELYRYDTTASEREPETPVDAHNHALAALRYLVMGIDRRPLLAKLRSIVKLPGVSDEELRRRKKAWAWWQNEALWTRLR